MVDITEKLRQIKALIDNGNYFTINRARQYGKTTTLEALREYLENKYAIISVSFEGLGSASFEREDSFSREFTEFLLLPELQALSGIPDSVCDEFRRLVENRSNEFKLAKLSQMFTALCEKSEKPVVLIIDEVDNASNNQIFLDFLGILRNKYLRRNRTATFKSVILAGVYDVKNLKQRFRPEEEHKYNSPWNIAADFDVDMSFHPKEIATMLTEYEDDWHTGMDIHGISHLLYDYTSGYPFLVSRLCKLIDENVAGTAGFPTRNAAWTRVGLLEAVKILGNEQNTLFNDLIKKLNDHPELTTMVKSILFNGTRISFESGNYCIQLGLMFGFFKAQDGLVTIANRIFETKLYNLFISEDETTSVIYKAAAVEKNRFIINGMLQMDLVMKKFYEHFTEIYSDSDSKFIEENGRRIFLLYLKPIINGTGNYYVEAQTRDYRRTDIVVDYKGAQFIIELKLWHGDEYNHKGELQLADYLDYYKADKGYLLSFNFNKNKKTGVREMILCGKRILEVVV